MTERTGERITILLVVGFALCVLGGLIATVRSVYLDNAKTRYEQHQLEQRVENDLNAQGRKAHVKQCLRFETGQMACAVEYEIDDATTKLGIVPVTRRVLYPTESHTRTVTNGPTSDGGVE